MPEGDTILRSARTLHLALAGRRIVRAESRVAAVPETRLVARTVTSVDAKGKNLFIRLDDGFVLHSHMKMHGSWHLYKPGERWRQPKRFLRVALETDAFVAACFSAPVVTLTRAVDAKREVEDTLGPDILAVDFDAERAVALLRARNDGQPIGVAVMDQGAVSGIGNIYKSESLFAARVSPFAPVSSLDDATLHAVLAAARRLMQRNVSPEVRARVTADSLHVRFAVYLRAGKPCPVCDTEVAMQRQGETRRSTYYCPRCQAEAPSPARGRGLG